MKHQPLTALCRPGVKPNGKMYAAICGNVDLFIPETSGDYNRDSIAEKHVEQSVRIYKKNIHDGLSIIFC
jgi:hypothetical protein